MTRRHPSGLAAALLAGLAALPAPAQEETEGTPPFEAAWLEAYEMQGDVLTPEQRTELSHLAWHAAVANICDGLALDHAKFGAALGALQHADIATMSDREIAYYEHHLAVNFGVAVGIMLATHTGDAAATEAYCGEIERILGEEEEGMRSLFYDPAADTDTDSD